MEYDTREIVVTEEYDDIKEHIHGDTVTVSVCEVYRSFVDEDGEWMDGGWRELESPVWHVYGIEPQSEGEHESLNEAVNEIIRDAGVDSPQDGLEASGYPIADTVGDHSWVSGHYCEDGHETCREWSIRVHGVSEETRADVFRYLSRF
ncbi:hypothetical protein [Glycomyces sp. NPDC048151]|uniref:hypothetical protein n=1 Tax=Glycomyces sp. NPDC048151 TaxID=3364002 RepID=UPI003716EA09